MKVITPMWPDPFGTSQGTTSYHRDLVGLGDLSAVRAHVKTLGGSINDVVLAAYFLSISDLTGHCDPIPIFFPVNLRQHLNDGSRVMSNQAANVSFIIGRKAGEGMDEVLPRVIGETKVSQGRTDRHRRTG